ncbi:MAG TPA: hypothetical protein VFS27_11540 [Blastocatellia bacterium]|jgi:hypothetical protein|nr:hypothetical protein [Blastocatellia bacterium]
MQRTTEQDERMFRYLLGDLPENEQMAVEQEYFADPEKVEEIWAAENDLVDRYAQGRLSRGERELFELNYLRSPKHRERVALARKLLGAADLQAVESDSAPVRLTGILSALLRPRFLATATAFLLSLSILSWLLIERSRLNGEIEKARARLSDQQRREREVLDQLATEREQSRNLKSELDGLLESISQGLPLKPPSILSFLLTTGQARIIGSNLQQITIPPGTDLLRLRMKLDKDDSRRFRAAIRAVGGPQVWSRRSIESRSGAITVYVPTNKLPVNDYILTLSVKTPTGETEEIKNYSFRVLKK